MAPKNRKIVKQPLKQPAKQRKSKRNLWLIVGIIAIIIVAAGAYAILGQPPSDQTPTPTATPSTSPASSPSPDSEYTDAPKVLLETTAGDITLELRTDKPITTNNFVNLVREGKYDNTVFHRTMAGFMIQGGMIDGSTASIADEIGTNNRNEAYTIAMAKTNQPNSATSQFFINVVDNGNNPIDQQGTKFDAVYTQFGRVIEGQNVVDAIANAPVNNNPMTGEPSVPVNPVTLTKATIIS